MEIRPFTWILYYVFFLPPYFSDYSDSQIIPQNSIELGIKLGIVELLTSNRRRKVSLCYIASILETLEPEYTFSRRKFQGSPSQTVRGRIGFYCNVHFTLKKRKLRTPRIIPLV